MPNNTEPECFGRLWEPSAPECAGGYDRAFVGQNGTKVRLKCEWFEPCRQRLAWEKGNQSPPLIAPQSLLRAQQQAQGAPFQPPTPFQPQSYIQPPGPNPFLPQQHAPVPGKPPTMVRPPFPTIPQVPSLPQFQPYPQQHYPPQQAHYAAPQHQIAAPPIQMVPTSYAVPRFLSTPEKRENGEFWGPIARESIRGAGKGLFATLASFFDHVAFRGKDE